MQPLRKDPLGGRLAAALRERYMKRMAGSSSSGRVRRQRDRMRAQGMRPFQLWVPDTRAPGFAEEAARQGRLVGATYAEGGENAELLDFLDRLTDDLLDCAG